METAPVIPGQNKPDTNIRNRNIIIACVIFDVILLAGVAYYFFLSPTPFLTPTAPEIKTTETQIAAPETSSDYLFDAATAKYGDTVAGLTISQVGPFNAKTSAQSFENVVVIFKGEITVNGKWEHSSEGMMGPITCMEPDKASVSKLPKAIDASTNDRFCFNDTEGEKLGPAGTSGSATVVIDDFTYFSYPTEGSNTAKLVKIISTD